MSKAKELRTNPENNINIYELLSLFSPDKKSKYTEMMLRLMKKSKNFKEHVKEVKEELIRIFPFLSQEEIDELPDLTVVFFFRFLENMFNFSDITSLRKFFELNERGLIKQNDVSKYNTFDEVFNSLSIAEIAADTKDLEKQIKVVHEDDEWLVIRPLTFAASKKYGSNTKWCTTSEGNAEYFMKYSKRGVLVYTINTVTGYKVATFNSLDKNDPEYSWWNQKDTRIDSYQSELTNELRDIIWKECTVDAKTNRFLLSDDERMKEERILNKHSDLFKSGAIREMDMSEQLEQPREPQPIEEISEAREARYNQVERRNEERRARERRLLGELTQLGDVPATESESEEPVESVVDRMRWSSLSEDVPTTSPN